MASAPTCTALIVAAGRGERFGADKPKQYVDLLGEPVLRRSIQVFRSHPAVTGIQVVFDPQHADLYRDATAGLDLPPPVTGGVTRQESVRHGLECLAAHAEAPDLVLVHDGARPLVDHGTISRVIEALASFPAAIAATPLADTLKRAEPNGLVAGTVDRRGLWRARTPQGFRFPEILAAHRDAAGLDLTDDAAVAERAELPVVLVHSNPDNLKVTHAYDLARAERLILTSLADVRTGTGFDVHRFQPGDHVMLCGVRVPHDHGLEGHSDADVGLHALTDAILGALCAGDIGQHFPPSDPKWKGADSAAFLQHAAKLVADQGGVIAHADVTLICEKPKVGPHRAIMVSRLAEIMGIDPARVSVKATTTEGLGFTGRKEGIAAQAACTIRLPL